MKDRRLMGIAVSLLLLPLLIAPAATFAEVIAIEREPRSFFESAPTMTMFWPARAPKATILVVLGGGGAIGIKPETTALRNQTANMLKLLTDGTNSKGMINVAVFDSPHTLQQAGKGVENIAPRYAADHLVRVENVVRFYRGKVETPLWLMGHSNGTVSVAEFINRSPGNRKLIDGAILSGSRNEARISGAIDFPVLFLHHENDGCSSTTVAAARAHLEALRSRSTARTDFLLVRGGTAAGNPCTDGHHMYREAFPEAASLIEGFVLADH